MNTKILSLICLLLAGLVATRGMAQTSIVELKDLVAQLQSSPDDMALRKAIIKKSLTTPVPATPDEVTELFGKAKYIVKQAKSPADYKDAVDTFKQASVLAPWSGDIYYNLAVVQEKAGQPVDAANSYRLYLLAKPHAKDKKAMQEKIGALGYMSLKKSQDLTGAKWRFQNYTPDSTFKLYLEIECTENSLTFTRVVVSDDTAMHAYHAGDRQPAGKTTFEERKFVINLKTNKDFVWLGIQGNTEATGTISEDGKTITIDYPQDAYNASRTEVYERE